MHVRGSARLVTASFVLGVMALGVSAVPVAAAERFVVRSTLNTGDANLGDDICDADAGPAAVCTLYAAIEEANADGDRDRIAFRIGGSGATGVKVIDVDTGLPAITEPLEIDGYTQPTARPNTAARGTNARVRVLIEGLGVTAFQLNAPAEIRGLAIRGVAHGIEVGVDGAVIAGNFIGTNAAGTSAIGNVHGIVVRGRARIGGPDRADRNLISGNANAGIVITGDAGTAIRGNLIGTRANGRGDLGNTWGILIEDSRDVVVGGPRASMANVIAFNDEAGVWVERLSDPTTALIRRNSFFANGDGIRLDLGTANDDNPPLDSPPPPDTDTGANDWQNHPVIASARSGANGTVVRGRLLTTPNKRYRIELFTSPGGDEGRTYLGDRVVTTNGDGIARWTFRDDRRIRVGHVVTSTATDLTDDETSEFSAAKTVKAS